MVQSLELVQAQFVMITSEMEDGGLKIRVDYALIVVINPLLVVTNSKGQAQAQRV